MMREWMTRQMEANERMKNQVVELENRINQGLRNRQAIIENLERQFKYLEKIQPSKSLPHTINTKPRHEFVYKTIPQSGSLNDRVMLVYQSDGCDDVLLNHVGGEELKSFDGVGIRRMTKKKKNDLGLPKEPNKEWKQNEKVVPTNKENVDHYLWHLTKIPHLNPGNGEGCLEAKSIDLTRLR
ncbi:hypothetical protein Tco_0128213 [Tanacetum coccineum]